MSEPLIEKSDEVDVSAVQNIMETVLPNPEVRHFVMRAFLESAEMANEGVPRTWHVKRHDHRHIVLSLWNYYHFSIGPWRSDVVTDICLSIDRNALSDDDQRIAEELSHGSWNFPKSAFWVDIPVKRVEELFPRFLPAHHALLRQNRNRRSPHYRNIPPDIDAYFRAELGQPLPTPKQLPPTEAISLSPEADRIRKGMELLFPDKDLRLALLDFMADAIEVSHEMNPNAWVLAEYRSGRDRALTFYTGWMMTIQISKKGLVIRGERAEIPEELREIWAPYVIALPGTEKLQETVETYEFPTERAVNILQEIESAWRSTARKNLVDNKISRFRKDHCSPAVEYLAWATGRELPQPAYVESARQQPTSPYNAWKISSSDKGLSAAKSKLQRVIGLSFLPHLDMSTLPTDSFEAYLEAIPSIDRAPNHGPTQLWWFTQKLDIGDRVYLYEGGAIRAFGTVTGDYEFIPGDAFPHQRSVDWEDVPSLLIKKIPPELREGLLTSFSTLDPVDSGIANQLDLYLAGKARYDPPVDKWKGDWRHVYSRVFEAEGLHYTLWQQAVFFTALQTKGFVILSGISGTGKTKIAQAFAGALPSPADGRAIEFLTVRPDWRDSKSLIGYHNPITDRYEWTPFLRFLMRAVQSWEVGDGLAWFVILDEMNLAHVEHYFAELLSIIESGRDAEGWSREAIRLGERHDDDAPPAEIKLPPNLAIIGTVNLDETTHAFSPKVLDRAFAMELSEVSFEQYQPGAIKTGAALTEPERHALLLAFSNGGTFSRIDRARVGDLVGRHPNLRDWLQTLNGLLRPFHMHFGYRVFDEVLAFVDHAERNRLFVSIAGDERALEAAFDAAVQMKILPKFHGSRQRLEEPLIALIAWCQDPSSPDRGQIREIIRDAKNAETMEAQLARLPHRFEHTANRAIRLLWSAHVEGFAAFG